MPAVLRQNWWALAVRGLAGIIFGIITFIAPGITVAALVILFGAYALVDGIFSIIAAWRAPDGGASWGALLIEGIAGIVAGVLTFAWPIVTAAVLIFFIAGWAIVTGILEIVAGIRLRRLITREWILIAMGVLSVIFGIALAIAPGIGALVIALWIGSYALVFGALMLVLAFRLRTWLRSHPGVDPAFGRA
jgi:uncharacterized membrane protein HdeD (DUF308 family)